MILTALVSHFKPIFSFTTQFSIIALLTFTVTACLPVIQETFQAPIITGTVLNLETLQPIKGAVVKHEVANRKIKQEDGFKAVKNSIVTNEKGEYLLPSISSTKFVVLMPAHALALYPVRITTIDNSAIVFASATQLMRNEETVRAALLIMDPHPAITARPPAKHHIDDSVLRTYLTPHSALGYCDLSIGKDAIAALNTARKAYWRYKDKEIANTAYLNASDLWNYFYKSCDFGDENNLERRDSIYAARKIIDKITKEISDIGNR